MDIVTAAYLLHINYIIPPNLILFKKIRQAYLNNISYKDRANVSLYRHDSGSNLFTFYLFLVVFIMIGYDPDISHQEFHPC